MNLRQKKAHMRAAYVYADLSYCVRRKVGCVIVLDNRIISIGYNGTPPGECNCCEDPITNQTISSVIHAEDNALRKLPRSMDLTKATAFVTLSPCVPCAGMIIDRGIRHVVYDTQKRSNVGIELLLNNDVLVEQLTP